jgi:hypothetical protein
LSELRCAYVKCGKVIESPKPGQKFCSGSACRSAQWHLENDPHCPDCGARLKLQLIAEVGSASVESGYARQVEATNNNPPIPPELPRPDSAEAVRERAKKPNIFTLYENEIGKMTPYVADLLREMEGEYKAECIRHAFQEAAGYNIRNLKYIQAICERHKVEGCFARKGRRGAPSQAEVDTAVDWLEKRYREGKKRQAAEAARA